MTITVIEALTLLNSPDYKSPSALQQLAMDLSVEANGKVTVLYGQSIDVGGVSPENTGTLLKTAAIAEQLANDPDVRIIDKTAFAKIVSSQAFERAVAEAHGCTWDQFKDFKSPPSPEVQAARNFLNDAKNGIWAKGSERFTMETKGPVETLSFNADPTRTLSVTELPAGLKTLDITTINGVYLKDLVNARQEMIDSGKTAEAADRAIFDHLNQLSGQRATNLEITLDADKNVTGVGSREWLSKSGHGEIGIELPAGSGAQKVTDPQHLFPIDRTLKTVAIDPARVGAIADAKQVNDLITKYSQERFSTLSASEDVVGAVEAGKYLNRANAVGMVMGLMLIGSQAVAAEQAGNHQEAKQIVTDGLAEFAKGAAFFGGTQLAASAIGALIGLPLGTLVGGFLAVYGAYEAFKLAPALVESIANLFTTATQATQPIRRDPLVFDLDKDGLETTGISATNPIYFDHDDDGIKTASGWVKSDDAFLVLDKNANGLIDSGRELFGDATLKSNGRLATDGFDALQDLDSNGDGKINSNDSQFANLRLWRDLNQDGISQSNELLTLSSQNIAAINVSSTDHSQILSNGNQLADIGSYIKDDGSSGTLGEVSGNLGDINLAQDTFRSQFTGTLDTSSVAQLPNLQGSGQIRSLREAATLSPALEQLLSDFATASTRGAQQALLTLLLKAWSDTSTMPTSFTGSYDGHILTVNGLPVAGGATSIL